MTEANQISVEVEDRTVRVVMVDAIGPRAHEVFVTQLPDATWHFTAPTDDGDDNLTALVRGAAALITRRRVIGADLIEAAGHDLRLIQIQGHLADRADLDAAHRSGVPVAVMPSRGCIAVAEHTLALILALMRRVVAGHAGVVGGLYRARHLTPTITSETQFAFNWLAYPDVRELNGQTLGIVGFGEIGQEVARRARAFGMQILYHARRRLAERFERELAVTWVLLDDLITRSDVVTVHVPHTRETEHLLDARRLGLMKPSAYLVNTSRGGVVDEAALVAHLRRAGCAGAGLDVFVEEPLPAGHPLTTLSNVVLTPHIAGGSGGGQRVHARETLENVARALRGDQPLHLVAAGSD